MKYCFDHCNISDNLFIFHLEWSRNSFQVLNSSQCVSISFFFILHGNLCCSLNTFSFSAIIGNRKFIYLLSFKTDDDSQKSSIRLFFSLAKCASYVQTFLIGSIYLKSNSVCCLPSLYYFQVLQKEYNQTD